MKTENKIITVVYNHHSETTLMNDRGDTFTFNPIKHEGLADFLN